MHFPCRSSKQEDYQNEKITEVSIVIFHQGDKVLDPQAHPVDTPSPSSRADRWAKQPKRLVWAPEAERPKNEEFCIYISGKKNL